MELKKEKAKKRKMALIANPHYYDYIRQIVYNGDNSKLVAGENQCFQLNITGTIGNPSPGILKFKFPSSNDLSVEFDIVYGSEDGRWIFKQDVVWNQAEEDWPILIFTRRYIFQEDPIEVYYLECQIQKSPSNEDSSEASDDEDQVINETPEEKSLRIYYSTSTLIHTTKDKLSEEDLALLDIGCEKKKIP